MKKDGIKPNIIRIDGGMSKNNWLVQFLSDIINLKVDTSKIEETTALGAAYMAGLQKGIYKSLYDISKNWKVKKRFYPKIKNSIRQKLLLEWSKAIKKALLH